MTRSNRYIVREDTTGGFDPNRGESFPWQVIDTRPSPGQPSLAGSYDTKGEAEATAEEANKSSRD